MLAKRNMGNKIAILETPKKNKELLIAGNVLFAILSIFGQVGVNVTLPLASGVLQPRQLSSKTETNTARL